MTTVIGGSSPSITFSDSTTQSTAALPLTGGTLTGALTPSTTAGIVGTTIGDNANAGSVGEYIASIVTGSSPVSLPSNASFAVVTSINLTAGDWDVSGIVDQQVQSGTITTESYASASTSTTSANIGTDPGTFVQYAGVSNPNNATTILSLPPYRYNLTSTTTIYLNARCSYTGTATVAAYGIIRARRVR